MASSHGPLRVVGAGALPAGREGTAGAALQGRPLLGGPGFPSASHPLPIRGGGMGQGGVASVPVPMGQGQSEGRCAVPDVLPLPAGSPAPPLGSAGTVARVLGAGALTSQVWARRLLACTVALAGSLVCVLDSKPGENAHSGLPAHQRVSRGWLTRWHVGMPSNVYSIEQR